MWHWRHPYFSCVSRYPDFSFSFTIQSWGRYCLFSSHLFTQIFIQIWNMSLILFFFCLLWHSYSGIIQFPPLACFTFVLSMWLAQGPTSQPCVLPQSATALGTQRPLSPLSLTVITQLGFSVRSIVRLGRYLSSLTFRPRVGIRWHFLPEPILGRSS